MPIPLKIVFKKKPNTELTHVKSTVGSLVNEFSFPVKDHTIYGKACSDDKQQNSTKRKRKSSDTAANISDYDEVFTGTDALTNENGRCLTMDITKLTQCANVLGTLMNHKSGWVFNQPVDPIKLNIPDYFSIISKPMDLGTIKHKLERKLYSSALHFAEDVRLTFSNAMRYNPPYNFVHMMAKGLNDIFNSSWESLEFKWRKESSISSQPSRRKIIQKKVVASNSLSSKSLSAADKLKLQKILSKISRRNIPPPLLKFLQKASLLERSEDRINVDIEALDEATLWELHRVVNFDAKKLTKSAGLMRSSQGSMKERHRGTDGASVTSDCPSSCPNDCTRASFTDFDSERLSGEQNLVSHSIDLDIDHIISDPSSPASASPLKDVELLELSPTRALRAANLKSRFAETILKAQNKTLLHHGEKGNSTKMQRETEKLKKKQQEEKARIEAEIKAVEAAVRMKAEAELKMQREREREAARLALQKMEKTVDIDENNQIFKDLENLGYSLPNEIVSNFREVAENPLAQLGLYMKEDSFDDDEVDNWICSTGNGDVEEGEIGRL